MPPKKKSLKAASAAYAICNTEVENSKDECPYCQSCSQKFHPYCAGAALSEHKMYVNGSSYECFHCFKGRKEATVTDLKDCIAALKAEILEVCLTVQELSSKVEAAETENRKVEPSWSQVIRCGKKRQQKHRQEPQPARQTLNPTRQARKSVQAVGARKIWGTLKTITSAAVKNALSSLTKVSSSDLQMKRKYKSSRRNPDTVAKWLFVIRGEENKLQELEGEWRAIAMQTAWKLEPV